MTLTVPADKGAWTGAYLELIKSETGCASASVVAEPAAEEARAGGRQGAELSFFVFARDRIGGAGAHDRSGRTGRRRRLPRRGSKHGICVSLLAEPATVWHTWVWAKHSLVSGSNPGLRN